jgi:hypothetical protein
MPLSEDEQRILQEIEAQFYATDPGLAQQVSETTIYRHATRNIKWAALGLILGFALLVMTFQSSLFLGFLGFAAMVGAAFVIERNLRRIGKAGLEQFSASMRGERLRSMFGDAGKRMRGRFRRNDDDPNA